MIDTSLAISTFTQLDTNHDGFLQRNEASASVRAKLGTNPNTFVDRFVDMANAPAASQAVVAATKAIGRTVGRLTNPGIFYTNEANDAGQKAATRTTVTRTLVAVGIGVLLSLAGVLVALIAPAAIAVGLSIAVFGGPMVGLCSYMILNHPFAGQKSAAREAFDHASQAKFAEFDRLNHKHLQTEVEAFAAHVS